MTGPSGCSVLLLEEPDTLVVTGSTVSLEQVPAEALTLNFRTEKTLTAWVGKHALPLRIDMSDEHQVSKYYERPVKMCEIVVKDRTKGFAASPICTRGLLFGVLRISRTKTPFSAAEGTLLDEIAVELAEQLHDAKCFSNVVLRNEKVFVPSRHSLQIVPTINERLIDYLQSNPREIHNLDSRQFEELIAFQLQKDGWETCLTAPTRDGGFDIRAIQKIGGFEFCLLVEAKKYRADRPVGVG